MVRLLINRNQTQYQQVYKTLSGNIVIAKSGYHFSDNKKNDDIIKYLIENYDGFELIDNPKTKSNPNGVDVFNSGNSIESESDDDNKKKDKKKEKGGKK